MKLTSNKFFYPILLVMVFMATYIYTFDPKIAQLGDNASYYMLGKALSNGEGFVNVSRITRTPNNHYPPGYPAILSVAMQISDDFVFLKVLNGLFFLGSVLLLFYLIRKITGSSVLSFICGLAVLGNFHLQQYSSLLMSEVPFMFFTLGVLYLLTSLYEREGDMKDWRFWAALLMTIIAYYIRSLGLALVAGMIFYLAMDRKWKEAAATFVVFVAAAMPWFLRSQRLGGGSYTRQLKMINPYRPELGTADTGDIVKRVFENLERYISVEIPYALFPVDIPDYSQPAAAGGWVAGIIIIALTLFGVLMLPRMKWLLLGYLLATFGILMLWPDVWVGVRFMIPVIPLLIFGFLNGTWLLLERLFKYAGKSVAPGWLAVVVLFMSLHITALNAQSRLPLHPAWKNYYAMAE